ncbi:hypothetical protein Fot_04450 [Forsythia ovata]|uniref:Uncharacterized protein n=1 Tax=Forsythia ovata TaxID=205694 RepID=A0ABD1XCK5_9LAMI
MDGLEEVRVRSNVKDDLDIDSHIPVTRSVSLSDSKLDAQKIIKEMIQSDKLTETRENINPSKSVVSDGGSRINKRKQYACVVPSKTVTEFQNKCNRNSSPLDDGLVFTDEDLGIIDQLDEKKPRSDHIAHPHNIEALADQSSIGALNTSLRQKIHEMPRRFHTKLACLNLAVQLYKYALEKPKILAIENLDEIVERDQN